MRYLTRQGEIEALADISLTVAPGEFLSIVGPSGCGKSTLLSLIAGILRPTAGQVLLDGQPVTGPSRKVGYMLQRDHLLEWRTVMGNCLIGPEVQGLDLAAARRRVKQLLAQTGLSQFQDAYPDQLSGGMRQRVALVRTLTIDPDILLLDEPFSALDFQTRLTLADEVWTILKREQKTAVLVTHDISEAISLGDRVVVLSRRPARVKAEHIIRFDAPRRPSPLQARSAPEHNTYFQRIWEELQSRDAE
ncbi:MAG TPA: ABC transporter ATP-binding protein [Symbiobacteriaceae bacterium]